MKDTADEVSTLEELLKATINRARIAQILIAENRQDLLPTILEDIFFGAQLITDNHCIKEINPRQ